MTGNLVALTLVVFLALGFYGVLSMGAAESLREAFVPESTPTPTPAPPTPTPEPEATPEPSPSPAPAPPETASPPPPQQGPPNRMNCDAIRGTQYLSPEERSWYLGNCLGAPNRANCDAIRGTQYLSTVERQWYLTFCS